MCCWLLCVGDCVLFVVVLFVVCLSCAVCDDCWLFVAFYLVACWLLPVAVVRKIVVWCALSVISCVLVGVR